LLNEKVTTGTPSIGALFAMITGPLGAVACRNAASTQPRCTPHATSHQLKPASQPNTWTAAPGGMMTTEG